jgi:hypothetical protein
MRNQVEVSGYEEENKIMSDITIGNILKQIEDLPFIEQWRLHNLLGDKLSKLDKAPPDRRVPPKPMPEGAMRAIRWITEHAREYAGQWVALDGDRLIAHGRDHDEVWAAAQASGVYLPMVTFVEDPDKIYMGL